MTKQTEIREEIKDIIKTSLNRQFAAGATADGTYIYYSESIADQILLYLHSQGIRLPDGSNLIEDKK